MDAPLLLTVGHSNRSTAEFLALLATHRVAGLVDVRRHPGSRRHPHMSRRPLAAALTAAGIAYAHVDELGGHREARDDSPHTALDPTVRGYADHMDGPGFARGLARLAHLHALVRQGPAGAAADGARAPDGPRAPRRLTLMCAEARPDSCHRRLLCDRLVTAGWDVRHAVDAGEPIPHQLSPEARVEGGVLHYQRPRQETLPGF